MKVNIGDFLFWMEQARVNTRKMAFKIIKVFVPTFGAAKRGQKS
jgi:hypothetical protein